MHYTTNYTGTNTENEQSARNDVVSYLGGKREYNKKLKVLRAYAEGVRHGGGSVSKLYRNVRASLALFLGIEGYWPVRAIMRDVLSQ